ncbi:helix-turn-helix domain-containing protein [Streptomyces sp. NPDC042319]|uniref:nSTAND1 domain-containing NTPase n=1 Tax=Streptomyces sp. NPDC042319 TaxID=3154332 RepID=UPI0033FB8DDA
MTGDSQNGSSRPRRARLGRPEKPVDPADGPVEQLAWELRRLREEAGSPSYRALARTAHYSPSTLAEAAKGERLPSLEVLLAYAQACGGTRAHWERRWQAAAAGAREQTGGGRATSAPCPYPGLAAFGPEDAEVFFGRDALTKELARCVERGPLTVVLGASGSGKSSLIRAGLLAGLDQRWQTVLLTPGTRPLEEMAGAVAPVIDADADPDALRARFAKEPGALDLALRTWLAGRPETTRALLVVDQFEELYTSGAPEEERRAFLAALADLVQSTGGRAHLLLGVRADFYPHCLAHPAFAAAARTAAHLPVGPPTREELAEIITAPAARAGVSVDGDLLQVVLGEAADQPGALPLVAHALREAWTRHHGAALRLADFQEAGGMRGAVAQTCERLYDEATGPQQQIMRQLFLRLTALGEGTEDTRRRLARSELDGLATPGETEALLQRLADRRVLVLADGTVEVAHEAVIRAWPRLGRWLEEDRASLHTHRRLTAAAATWQELHRESAALYRGTQLATAQAWTQHRDHTTLNTLERDFLAHSARAEHRRTRRARFLTTTLATLLVLALLAAVTAYRQRNDAQSQRRAALAAQHQAQSRQLAGRSDTLLGTRPDLAALLAVHAYRTSPTAEATTSLYKAANLPLRHRLAATGPAADGIDGVAVAYSPDGRTLATAGWSGTVRVWNAATGRLRTTLTGHKGDVTSVAFSPDGHTLLIGGADGAIWRGNLHTGRVRATALTAQEDVGTVFFSPDRRTVATGDGSGTVHLWNIETGRRQATLTGHQVASLAFSPDGHTLATSDFDNRVRLWDATTGTTRTTLADRHEDVAALVFSPDGRTLATGSSEGRVRLWNVRTGQAPVTFTRPQQGEITALAFSPGGDTLATGGYGPVHLWDTRTGRTRATLVGHTGRVDSLAFGPHRHTLAAGGGTTARLWDTRTGRTLPRHHREVGALAFSPGGQTLVTGSADGTTRLSATATGRTRTTFTGSKTEVNLVHFSRDGRTLTTAGSSEGDSRTTVRITDARTGRVRLTRTGPADSFFSPLAITPDGRTLAIAGGAFGSRVRLWDPRTGRTRIILTGHRSEVTTAAFHPTQHTLVTGDQDGTLRLWNTQTGHTRTIATGHSDEAVTAVAYSPDGHILATADQSGAITLRNPATGRARTTLTGHKDSVDAAVFTPDGRTLATSSADGSLRLWDTRTGHTRQTLAVTPRPHGPLAFSPDGHTLAAIDGKTVHLWTVDLPTAAAAVRHICTVIGRDLTSQERATYLPHTPSSPICKR